MWGHFPRLLEGQLFAFSIFEHTQNAFPDLEFQGLGATRVVKAFANGTLSKISDLAQSLLLTEFWKASQGSPQAQSVW